MHFSKSTLELSSFPKHLTGSACLALAYAYSVKASLASETFNYAALRDGAGLHELHCFVITAPRFMTFSENPNFKPFC